MSCFFPVHLLDPDPQPASSLQKKILKEIHYYRRLAQGGKWWQLYRRASKINRIADEVFNTIAFRDMLYPLQTDALRGHEKLVKNKIKKLQKEMELDPSVGDKLRDSLRQKYGDSLGDKYYKKFTNLSRNDIQFSKIPLNFFEARNDRLRDKFVVTRIYTLRASGYGAYGSSYRRTINRTRGNSKIKAGALDFVKEVTNQYRLELEKSYDRLYKVLYKQNSIEDLLREARDISSTIKLSNGYLCAIWGSFVASAISARKDGGQDPIAKVCIDASKLMADREILFAYCSYLEVHAIQPSANSWYRYETERAQNRQSGSELPKGIPTTIERIIAGDFNADDLYRITGTVTMLRIEDDPAPPKFSSFFDLVSIEDGSHVVVRAHMFSLENNGLQNSKLCEIVGRIRGQVPWSVGSPGIDIDRVNLSELRKSSWKDDVLFRMRKYSIRYRDEMNMDFTPVLPI